MYMKRPCPLSLSLLYVRESRLWVSQRVALEPVPPRPPLPLSSAFSKKAARPFPLLLLLLRFDEGSRKDRAAKDVGEPLHAGRGNVRSTFASWRSPTATVRRSTFREPRAGRVRPVRSLDRVRADAALSGIGLDAVGQGCVRPFGPSFCSRSTARHLLLRSLLTALDRSPLALLS